MPEAMSSEAGAAVVRQIFDRVRNGDPALVDLYAEDGVCIQGATTMNGREAIHAFYVAPGGVFDSMKPRPRITHLAGTHPHYVALVEVEIPGRDTPSQATDYILLDDDGKVRLLINCTKHESEL